MTLLIKNGRYVFLIRLDSMLSMSLWKEYQLLQILNDLSIKHLIKLILHENDVKEKACKDQFVICVKCEILIIDTWNEYIKKRNGMLNLFFCRKFNIRMLLI